MKTTKKGFTLIELIVVIAIIGVLAALLVPAMLGYVKKSKIQSANSAAAEYCKAVSSAIADLEEEDKDLPATTAGTPLTFEVNSNGVSFTSDDTVIDADTLLEYVKSYTDVASNAEFSVVIKDGAAIYGAAKEGKYYGTSPKVFTQKNYPDDTDIDSALEAASSKYELKHPSDATD